MRIGYACINRTLDCTTNRSFRLANLTARRFFETADLNLACLKNILEYNLRHGLLYFRISSDLIPFASHPVMTFPWQTHFQGAFEELGAFVRSRGMRISMHPDQFILLNALDRRIVDASIRELLYHADVLDAMGLDASAKIQIHVGGVYGDKPAAAARFREQYQHLEPRLQRRLAIENDDSRYSLQDCLNLHAETGVPVILDVYHHTLLHDPGEPDSRNGLRLAAATWGHQDGPPMVDYSSPDPRGRRGKHAEHLDPAHFLAFIRSTSGQDFDVMLEIKDKEASALAALRLLRGDPRLVTSAADSRD